MRSVSYAALALAMTLAAPAIAADYKIVDKLKMPDGGWDYATSDFKKDVIYWVRNDHTDVIDAKTKKVTAKHKMAGCENASGLAYAAASKLLIASCGNGVAKVLTVEGKEVASIPIGSGPDAVIYDPKNKVAFIPCGTDGVLE